jgi:hypothetical protein
MNLGQIAIDIAAKSENLKAGLSKARSLVASFAKESADLLQKAFTSIGSSIATMLTKVFDEVGKSQENLSKLFGRSTYLKASINEIQALDYAVQKVGGSVGTFDVALRHMEKNVSLATRGLGPAKNAFKELGLSANLLADLSTFEQLGVINDAMRKLGDGAKRSGLEYQIFREHILSTSGVLNTDLTKTKEEWDKLGVGITAREREIVSLNTVARIEFNAMKEGFFNKFSIPIMSAMTDIINKMNDFIMQSGGVEPLALRAADGILAIFQSVESGLGSVTGVIRSINKNITEALIGYRQLKSFAEKPGEAAAEAVWSRNRGRELVNQGMDPDAARNQTRAEAVKMRGQSENSQALAQLKQDYKSILDAEAAASKQKSTSLVQNAREELKGRLDVIAGPFSSIAKVFERGITELNDKTRKYSDSQQQAALASEANAAAAEKAAKALTRFSENPSFGGALDKILSEEKKRIDGLQRETPDYLRKEILDAHNSISELSTGSGPAAIESAKAAIARVDRYITQEKIDRPRRGRTDDLESVSKDLNKYLQSKLASQQKVDVKVQLDMTEEMKKIIKVNGVYTDQKTVDFNKAFRGAVTATAR